MRPPLKFGNYKPEMKYYFKFDPDSGEVLEFSIEKKGNCVEISKELADKLYAGQTNYIFYKVILDKDGYKAVPKNAVESKTHTEIQQKDIVNTNLYEIKSNTNNSCIRFILNMTKKELNISIDSKLKASLQNSVDADNEYEFFATDDDNTSIPAYSFKIKLQNLFDNNIVIPHAVDYVPKIFCRKVFNYAYEVTQ
tara:strand:- start:406 stop:990 length:585 start_codon:yes stop_codon:yes gene_type:complete